MKRRISTKDCLLSVGLLVTLQAVPLIANANVSANLVLIVSCQEQQKIGYVDNVKMMEDYQEKKDFDGKYEIINAAFSKKKDSISQVFQIEMQAFQVKAQKMRESKAQEEYAGIQQRAQQMGQLLQQEEQGLMSTAQVELDSMVSMVKKEIKAYGVANKYNYILGGGDGGSVLYGTEANDLTAEIVKTLNDKYTKE
jgi:outer membrane protein